MCGIVGLYLKNPALRSDLGLHITSMLGEMSERGPDSSGIAIYRQPAPEGYGKITLQTADPAPDWPSLGDEIAAALGDVAKLREVGSHCVLVVAAAASEIRAWLTTNHPDIRIVSLGHVIEIFKDVGLPGDVTARFGISALEGTHALGHTRMATESAVTTEHSHPFSTGEDLCLVHNGSLSNHNRLRRWLRRRGVEFQTDNDTEVAAGYLTHHLREGASLREALEAGLTDLDGFFTFAVGTRDGFAVVRDAVACKPAVLAETDDWVAMASEYRSIAQLPGAKTATIWEPEPETIYTWGNA
ncbi:MAG: amidophosphoribosyltransferase [Proteobacteria bacterium]|nr:MAG: amidophosphoribosyltransferase [Pseudomonadota bacterium]